MGGLGCSQLVVLLCISLHAPTTIALTTAVFNPPQWVGNRISLSVTNAYPAAPGTKRLVVAGIGGCDHQTTAEWSQRLFGAPAADSANGAAAGSCDTWQRKQTHGHTAQWWFGEQSAQPPSTVFSTLALSDDLYGFDGALFGAENRLFELPSTPEWRVEERISGGNQFFDYMLDTNLQHLNQCTVSGDSAPLQVTNLPGGKTQYQFTVFSAQISESTATAVQVLCSSQTFTYQLAQFNTITFGGFTVVTEDPTADATQLVATVELTMTATSEFEFSQLLQIALENSIQQAIEQLSGDEPWDIVVTITAIAAANSANVARRLLAVSNTSSQLAGDFKVVFTVTFTHRTSTPIIQSRPSIELVVTHYSTSTTGDTVLADWQAAYTTLIANGPRSPNATVTIANSPFSILSIVAVTATTPTTAPSSPPVETSEDDKPWLIPVVVSSAGLVLVAGAAALIIYKCKQRRRAHL